MTAVPLRPSFRFVAALALCASAAAACGHDSSNATGTNSGSSNGFTVTIDSGSNLQIAVVGHSIHVEVTGASSSGGTGRRTDCHVDRGDGWRNAAGRDHDHRCERKGSERLDARNDVGSEHAHRFDRRRRPLRSTPPASADALRGLIKVSTDSQTVVASSSTAFVVRAVDQFNNPVPGIAVNWTSSGGTLTPAATATGNSGNAQTTFTTDSLPAKYTITASTPGFAPVTFTLTGS